MRRLPWLMLILLALNSLAHADTTWVAAGNVSGSWTAAHSPYMIGGDISVGWGATLAIGPGVKVYFRGPYRLSVDGSLSALGTVTDTIRFTTDTLANPQRWRGLELSMMETPCQMAYCIVEHASGEDGAVLGGFTALTLTHCLLRHNRGQYGGAIEWVALDETPLTLTDCLLEYNRAEGSPQGSSGGAIQALTEGPGVGLTLTRCVLRHNSCTGSGGGMQIYFGLALLSQCSFEDNVADGWGGGLYAMPQQLTLRDCVLRGNAASIGGGAYLAQGGYTIDHCVIDSNLASTGAAVCGDPVPGNPQFMTHTIVSRSSGPAFDGNQLLPRHCLFWGNADGNLGPNVENDILGAVTGENINGDSVDFFQNLYDYDPLFVNLPARDYHLTAASPCIDAGDSLAPPDPDRTITDIGLFPFFQPVSLSPRYLLMDLCGVNFWSDTAWVSLRNAGSEPARILSLETAPSSFHGYIAPADSTVAAGDSIAVRVIFAPDTCGNIRGSLVVHTDRGDARCRLESDGVGSYLVPEPLVINFGGVQLGQVELLQVTLRNLGNTSMALNFVTAQEPFRTDNVPASVPAHQARTVDIFCEPTVAGTFRDTLNIWSTAYNEPLPVVLLAVGAVTPDPPTVFDLLAPANGDTLPRWWDSTTFRWTASHDPYGAQAPMYSLYLQSGESGYEWGTVDTLLTVSLSSLPFAIQERDTLLWWVTAIGNPGATECAARFMLFTADTGEGITAEPLPYLPTTSALLPAYPNPFNAVTTLTFDVAQSGPVLLTLYNLLGEKVAALVDERLTPGRYHATWNAASAASGTYLAVLQSGESRRTQKLLLLK